MKHDSPVNSYYDLADNNHIQDIKISGRRGARLAQSEEGATLDLWVQSSNPMLGVAIT